jgi:hypothetical protein
MHGDPGILHATHVRAKRGRADSAAVSARARRSAFAVLLVVALACLAACTPVKSEPFTEFRESVEALESAMDEVVAARVGQAEQRYLDGLIEDPPSSPSQVRERLTVQRVDGKPLRWRAPEASPSETMLRLKAGYEDLMDAFRRYAVLLEQLASPAVTSTERFDQISADLNGNLREAAEALKFQDVEPDAVGMFSAAAGAAFRAYIAGEQRDELLKGVRENQSNVEDLSSHAQASLSLLAEMVWQEYGARTEVAVKPVLLPTTSEGEKRDALAEQFAANQELILQLRQLKRAASAIDKLPDAHAELAAAAKFEMANLSNIKALYSEAKRLQKLAKSLAEEGGDEENGDESDDS